MLFIVLTDDSSNDGNVFDSVCVYKYAYTCLCISEINESKGDKGWEGGIRNILLL